MKKSKQVVIELKVENYKAEKKTTPPLTSAFAEATDGQALPQRGGEMEKFVVVVPNIRSAHNVGAILRTADGAGVDKVYITGYSPYPPHSGLLKVSLGAENFVKWEYVKQIGRLLKQLKEKGYNIVALEQMKTSVDIFSWKPKFPCALVLGNEKNGVTKDQLKYCYKAIEIPMRGKKKSLNVSVATGIALYYISGFVN